jgi:hypothetical protein
VNAFESLYQAIRRYAEGDMEAAAATAHSVAGRGELYTQAARWLDRAAREGAPAPYLDAEAFAAFIGGGGNVAMYAALEVMLAAAWDEYRPADILDVGPGEGRVVAGALRRSRLRPPPAFDLVEPAANLLPRARERLAGGEPAADVHAHPQTIQAFLDGATAHAHWDVCQATWSLQNLSRTERRPVFAWLHERCRVLLVAEFDVQAEAHPLLSRERARLIHDRYAAGLAEYTGHMHPAVEERVKQGFLVPVFFGYFRSGAGRSTHEQSMAEWRAEIEAAGFRVARQQLIYRYWWADAYLIVALSARL